jgi:hypothetical protein
MIPRLANRTPRTRAARSNTGDPRLESLAAEFALLAQRRSRAVHRLETLISSAPWRRKVSPGCRNASLG